MSSVGPFALDKVELCIVPLNDKLWTRGKQVCKALKKDAKTSQTVNIVRAHCSL